MISIIIPIHNRTQLFTTTIESLKSQTYKCWLAIVVDDGSAPQELEHIRRLVATDPRFVLMSNSSQRNGASASRNIGLAATQSDYVIFLDADDALAPESLAYRLEALTCDTSLDFVAAPVLAFRDCPGDTDILWNRFDHGDDLDRFCFGDSPWNTNSVLWRRESLSRHHLTWNEQAQSFQDWDFHVRAIATGLRYKKLERPDCYWRMPTALGSIGSGSRTPAKALNRARVLRNAFSYMRAKGKMTPYRRRALSRQFYRETFEFAHTRRRILSMWRSARKCGAVSGWEFVAILGLELIRRLGRRIVRFMYSLVYPDYHCQSNYLRHRLNTTSYSDTVEDSIRT